VVDAHNLGPQEQEKQEKYLTEAIYKLSPKALVKVILQQPTVHLRKTAINTGYEASYEMKPVTNLYFLRDQMITTPRGVVLSKMNSSQRAVETKIVKFVLAKLGIKPLYEVEGNGRLEGGDFFPAGDTVFIGCGVRTNQEAVDQLLKNRVFDSKRVVVVNEKWHNQVQMHLDTCFNVIDKHLAVLVEDRYDCKNDTSNIMNLTADVYELDQDNYKLVSDHIDFVDFLTNDMGMKVIPVPKPDQLKYGVNFLTVKGNNILAVDGVSQGYKDVLKDAGVNAEWINFSNMTGGYGAAHCVTQVLSRN
jgi:arginine deiminase